MKFINLFAIVGMAVGLIGSAYFFLALNNINGWLFVALALAFSGLQWWASEREARKFALREWSQNDWAERRRKDLIRD